MERDMFYIEHEDTAKLVAVGSTGEHDVKETDAVAQAIAFDSRGDANDFSQNFGPSWNVVEL